MIEKVPGSMSFYLIRVISIQFMETMVQKTKGLNEKKNENIAKMAILLKKSFLKLWHYSESAF